MEFFSLRVTRFVKLASFLVLCRTAMAFSQFSCSFQSRTETACSYWLDKSRSLEIISLRTGNCSKNITDHCSYWSFSGVNTERELLLARVGVFSEKETSARKLDTICPYHRRELGIGWRRNSTVYPKSDPNMEKIEKQIKVFPK